MRDDWAHESPHMAGRFQLTRFYLGCVASAVNTILRALMRFYDIVAVRCVAVACLKYLSRIVGDQIVFREGGEFRKVPTDI